MVMTMWWSKLISSDFIQSIVKYTLLILAAIGLVKTIRKDAADDRENEIKADQAEKIIKIVEEKEAVHEEVNSYSDDEHIDLLQK